MECEGGGGGGDVGLLVRRAEIDTSAPFRSVKEAVLLFGERVLAGEIYAHKLNQIRNESIKNQHNVNATPGLEPIVAELEETKHSLQKAREESMVMANCLNSLAEELEKTKMELKQLKAKEPAVLDRSVVQPEIEDIKFVEIADEFEIKTETPMNTVEQRIGGLEKKRSVKFANPPSLVRIINPEEEVLQRQSSVEGGEAGQVKKKKKKKKKKKLIPTLSAMFSKKKACNHQDGSRAQGL